MLAADILALANLPTTPRFEFGSPELEKWTREHRDPNTCLCHNPSGWYVVVHRSPARGHLKDHLVLSRWNFLQVVPTSHDVPA
mgnify:CR=1 FL=1